MTFNLVELFKIDLAREVVTINSFYITDVIRHLYVYLLRNQK